MCTSAKKCLLSSLSSSLGCASARKLRLGRKRYALFGLGTQMTNLNFIKQYKPDTFSLILFFIVQLKIYCWRTSKTKFSYYHYMLIKIFDLYLYVANLYYHASPLSELLHNMVIPLLPDHRH
jgi:hypothetical protein